MAKKNNCRNCKYADWEKTKTGRRQFRNWAECTHQIDMSKIPASAVVQARSGLKHTRSVAEYRDVEINCPTFEPITTTKGTPEC